MKKNIQSFFILCLSLSVVLVSCSNFGKKIDIEGTKGEIYYTEGATENDAKKVGNYLKETGFLSNDKRASIQVSKIGERYMIRFVYDKEYYAKNAGLDDIFKTQGVKMSKQLFNGNKVDIALTDKYFKDFKSIPYDETAAEKLEQSETEDATVNTDKYDHDKAGGVNFYWKGISNEESKRIADYIVQNGAFAGGTAEIYMTKEGDRYILKFPVKEEYQNDAGTVNEIEKVAKEIKENVFPNTPYSFQMTDLRLNSLKSFDH